ncbi:ArnT family glycosyltransferase [Pseudanabaena sp. PCC 6802]|uniref:ArnT family glycosyltransferase n=1 Tax=Pseudanabaena sp. PCC 6802 TaxID=118173 RepID=UPI000345AC22|nr:hypothetical protein [Pseudanabaena sp. PCC 6802]
MITATEAPNKLSRWLAIGTILVLGFLVGMLGFYTWHKLPSPIERVSWSPEVQWIEPQESSFRMYARSTFYLNGDARVAWLKLSADNDFILYVNGETVDLELSVLGFPLSLGTKSSQLWQNLNDSVSYVDLGVGNHMLANAKDWQLTTYVDLTNYLRPGKNVIALELQKGRPSPRLALEGAVYSVANVSPIALSTGIATWRVSPVSENRGNLQWYESDFPDQNWAEAKLLGTVTEATYSRTSSHVYDRELQGNWIVGNESPQGEIWFRGNWQVPKDRQRAFIRFAGDGEYALTIDGLLVRRYSKDDGNLLRMFEVTNFLRSGNNTISVQAIRPIDSIRSPTRNGSLGFFLDGWVETASNRVTAEVATDSSWSSTDKAIAGWDRGLGSGQPVVELRPPDSNEFRRYFEGNAYLVNFPNYIGQQGIWQIASMACAAVGAWGLGRFWLSQRQGVWDSFNAGSALLLPGTLFLIGIGLLKHRYAEAERGILFMRSQSISLTWLGFIGIVVLTLLWSQFKLIARTKSQDGSSIATPLQALRIRWGLWFLFGLAAFVALRLLAGMGLLATIGSISLPVLGAIAIVSIRAKRSQWHPKDWWSLLRSQWPVWGQWVVLAVIIAVGFVLRARDLNFVPYDADENTSLDAVRGILRTGAPEPASKIWYTRGPFFHYMSAIWLALVGESFTKARFLIVLWGVAFLAVAFIFTRHITGKVWFALLIVAVFAIDPLELWNSRNFRFYQTVQCLNLLAFYFFCKGFIDKAGKKYQYGFFIAFTSALLNQEVSITLIPGFLLGFIFFYRPFDWKSDRHIAIGAFMTMSIYIYNGIFFLIRCLTPYVALTNTTETQMKFHMRDFTGFTGSFFFGSARLYTLYSLFFFLGFIYFIRQKNQKLVFLFCCVFLNLVLLTVMVLAHASRYSYSIYPLFIILSIYSAICLMASLGKNLEAMLAGIVPLQAIALSFLTLLLIFNIEPARVLDSYHDAMSRHNPKVFEYIRDRRQPGDVVFANLPAAAAINLGGLDYYLPPTGMLGFDGVYLSDGRLIDRWAGGEAVTTIDQMSRILAKANRVWIQVDDRKAPDEPELAKLYHYYRTIGKSAMETFGVRLRLWQKEDGLLPREPNQGQDLGAF